MLNLHDYAQHKIFNIMLSTEYSILYSIHWAECRRKLRNFHTTLNIKPSTIKLNMWFKRNTPTQKVKCYAWTVPTSCTKHNLYDTLKLEPSTSTKQVSTYCSTQKPQTLRSLQNLLYCTWNRNFNAMLNIAASFNSELSTEASILHVTQGYV
jgi:hypothetical protein